MTDENTPETTETEVETTEAEAETPKEEEAKETVVPVESTE